MDRERGTRTSPAPGVERLVVLALGGVDYGVRLEDAREVLRMVALVPVPGAPPWMLGIIDLRGRLVPVVDARVRLGATAAEIGLSTPILIVDSSIGLAGLVADAVTGVATLDGSAVGALADRRAAPFVRAVGRDGGRLLLLADVDAICAGASAFLPVAA